MCHSAQQNLRALKKVSISMYILLLYKRVYYRVTTPFKGKLLWTESPYFIMFGLHHWIKKMGYIWVVTKGKHLTKITQQLIFNESNIFLFYRPLSIYTLYSTQHTVQIKILE